MAGALGPLRRLLRRRAVPASVAVETDVGRLRFQAHDQAILPFIREHGRWETEEADQLRAWLRPGMTFVDVGAHVGYMTLLGAHAVGPSGRVLAVEPAPGNVGLLRENVAANGVTNVEIVAAAAMDHSGPVTLCLSPWNTGDNRAYPVPEMERVVVAGLRLDELVPSDVQVHVVKVDTQGTDHRVLKGMERTLARCRPLVLVEFWPPSITELGDDPVGVVDGYRSMGFEVRVLGADESSTPSSQEVVDAAEAAPDGFCSLVLRPAG